MAAANKNVVVMDEEVKQTLEHLYNDPKSPAAYAGVNRLWQEAKKVLADRHHITKKHVEFFLSGHRTYNLMRPRRVHFPRARTVPSGYMTHVQADLADMQPLAEHNSGNRYILVAIDSLSRQLFVEPLKSKDAKHIVPAFKKMFKRMPTRPWRLFTDQGKEFTNQQLRQLLDKLDIQKATAYSPFIKAAQAERAIRNLKQRLYRYFSHKQTRKWTDILQSIVNGINDSPSRALNGRMPSEVNFENAQEIWEDLYGDYMQKRKGKQKKAKFKENDYVMMAKDKSIFDKGFLPNYGDEILEIDAVKRRPGPIRYRVRDEQGEEFLESYYQPELIGVRKDEETSYRIEDVYETRKRKDGTEEHLVSFIGYPNRREWIHQSQLV